MGSIAAARAASQTYTEEPVVFQNGGENLFGILTRPAGETHAPVALLLLHGWSGYRIGPHGILVTLARRAAAAGYPSLRFDFRGRGDSEGEMAAANRASMIDDARAAGELLRQHTGAERQVLVGVCAGSQVAIGTAAAGTQADGMILWSAPVSAQAEEEKAVSAKRKHFLAEYARKLLRPQTWQKLVTGKLQPRKIARVLSGQSGKAAEDDRTVDLRAASRLAEYPGPLLFLYGTRDPIAAAALPYYQQLLAARQDQVRVGLIEDANHSFYGTAWKEEVLARSLRWLRERFPLG